MWFRLIFLKWLNNKYYMEGDADVVFKHLSILFICVSHIGVDRVYCRMFKLENNNYIITSIDNWILLTRIVVIGNTAGIGIIANLVVIHNYWYFWCS